MSSLHVSMSPIPILWPQSEQNEWLYEIMGNGVSQVQIYLSTLYGKVQIGLTQ